MRAFSIAWAVYRAANRGIKAKLPRPHLQRKARPHSEFTWMDRLSEGNFRLYGVCSTPTLVPLDGKGLVRMYHPGQMRADELRQALASVLK